MATRKVRFKKLSIKTQLPVLREDQIDPSEYEALTTETQISTGVEQAEEKEYHLQSILKGPGVSNHQEIPVPPPQESELSYAELYPLKFEKTSSYIRFSQTVEECIGAQYDMTTEDDEWLTEYNQKRSSSSHLSEDDFEKIMEAYEVAALDQTPYGAVDNTILGYDAMVASLQDIDDCQKLTDHFKPVYDHWRSGRQENGNRLLHPVLKFETHQESDEMDPYVCFRRREVRQTRKTRNRDIQSVDKLKRLRRELEEARHLVFNSLEREKIKQSLLKAEREVFDQRSKLKEMKIRLGIKTDDEDLINQKPQKRKAPEAPPVRQAPGAHLRLQIRPDGRYVENDLSLLADRIAEKENELQIDIEKKIENHRTWNKNYVDLTRSPLSPVKLPGFRSARTRYMMSPPPSDGESVVDIDMDKDVGLVDMQVESSWSSRPNPSPDSQFPMQPSLRFRRRVGRLNRLWIDRKGLKSEFDTVIHGDSDRYKYDSSDDEDSIKVDPFDTRAMRFRGTIPLAGQNYPRRPGGSQLAPHMQAPLQPPA